MHELDTRGDYSAARRAPRRDGGDPSGKAPVAHVIGSWIDDVAAARDKLEGAVETDVKIRLGIAAVAAVAATGLIIVLAKAADP